MGMMMMIGTNLEILWGAFHFAAVVLLPYKLHTSRSAEGETHINCIKGKFNKLVELSGGASACRLEVLLSHRSWCLNKATEAPAVCVPCKFDHMVVVF